MLRINLPSDTAIRAFLERQRTARLSYSPAGLTRNGESPPGLVTDHNRVKLGSGTETFMKARRAIENWRMFRLGWTKLFWPTAPIIEGTNVAVSVSAFGACWVNAARIVYVIDEETPIRRFGFAYGTLEEHAESGEERFSVEWHADTDDVWYDIFAVSRPNALIVQLFNPVARALQRRFARDSKRAMLEAVAESAP